MIRREFNKRLGSILLLALAGGSWLFTAACNVFVDLLNWVPVGEAALNSILSILSTNGVVLNPAVQAAISLINAGFTALTAAVKEYQSTTPAPVGALAKIETALHDIVDNFSTFLSSLSVSSGLLNIITRLAEVVLSTIAAFTNRLPASMSLKGVRDKMAAVRVGGKLLNVAPQERSRRKFKHDWNGTLKAAPSDVKVPANAYLPVSFWEKL